MALVLLDRAKVVATSMSGTGDNYTLTNAPPTGFVDFTGVGDGNTTYYVATDTAGNFEIGIGTFATSGEVLTRTDGNVIKSTNSNNKVSWPSNSTPTVFIAQPADKAAFLDANNNLTITSTDDGATADPTLNLYRNSSSPDVNDLLGEVLFQGRNNNSEDVDFASITGQITGVNDGSEHGLLNFNVISNGNEITPISIKGNGNIVFNSRNVLIGNNSSLIFEGSTNDNNEITIGVTDPTTDRTITLPDASGTVALESKAIALAMVFG